MLVHGSTAMLISGSTEMPIHGNTAVTIYRSTAMLTHESTAVPIHGSTAVPIHGSTVVLIHGSTAVCTNILTHSVTKNWFVDAPVRNRKFVMLKSILGLERWFGGENICHEGVTTRAQIAGIHINADKAWWPSCNPKEQEARFPGRSVRDVSLLYTGGRVI